MITIYSDARMCILKEEMNRSLAIHLRQFNPNLGDDVTKMNYIKMSPRIRQHLPISISVGLCGKCLYDKNIESYMETTFYPFCDCYIRSQRFLLLPETCSKRNEDIIEMIKEKKNKIYDTIHYLEELDRRSSIVDVITLEKYFRDKKITELVEYINSIKDLLEVLYK